MRILDKLGHKSLADSTQTPPLKPPEHKPTALYDAAPQAGECDSLCLPSLDIISARNPSTASDCLQTGTS